MDTGKSAVLVNEGTSENSSSSVDQEAVEENDRLVTTDTEKSAGLDNEEGISENSSSSVDHALKENDRLVTTDTKRSAVSVNEEGTSVNSSISVDQASRENDRLGITEIENSAGLVNEGTSENSSVSVDQAVKENDRSGTAVTENSSNSVDQAVKENDRLGITKTENSTISVNEGTSENPSNSVDQAVKETVIFIIPDNEGENGDRARKLGKVVEEDKLKMKELDHEKHSCVIDVKSDGGASGSAGGGEGFERVCRICQLIPEVLSEIPSGTCIKEMDLIQLGCGCKDGMGIVHAQCAETWFRLKGNRVCEICGEPAKNIAVIRDQTPMEEWNEVRLNGIPGSEGSEGCWRRKPFCKVLIACLVLAIILPWFLHVTWLF